MGGNKGWKLQLCSMSPLPRDGMERIHSHTECIVGFMSFGPGLKFSKFGENLRKT